MATVDMWLVLQRVDRALVKAGFPALSPFWAETCKRFLRSRAFRLTVRGGRRCGKGLTAAKLAAAFAAFADIAPLAPGELGVVAFLSVDRDEASLRLRQVAAMLDALGVAYTRRDGELELRDRPVVIRVLTASTTGVVGRSLLLGVCDEVARWRDVAGAANPAAEIIASLTPALLTMPGARLLLVSSPFGEVDYHAAAFNEGEDETKQVAHAPSWVGNPTITEEMTRRLEPNVVTWAREYAAEPQTMTTAVCSTAEYDAIVSADAPAWVAGEERIITTDPATRGDAWASAAWRHELTNDRDGVTHRLIRQVGILHSKPSFLRALSLEEEREKLLAFARLHHASTILADGHLAPALEPWFRDRGIRYQVTLQTSQAITGRTLGVQGRIAARTLALLPHEAQRKEVLAAHLTLHGGGRATLRAPASRGAHDDLVSNIMLACDPEVGAGKLQPHVVDGGGGVVVKLRRLYAHFEPGVGVTMAPPVFVRRFADGREEPASPPAHDPYFETFARGLLAQGISTPAIEAWAASRGMRVAWTGTCLDFVRDDDAPGSGLSVPVNH